MVFSKETSTDNSPAQILKHLQEKSSEPVYKRGLQYYRRRKVLRYEEFKDKTGLEALVIGSEPQPYKVELKLKESGDFDVACTCPYFEDICKHSVAVILNYLSKLNPGLRFELNENDRLHDNQNEKAPKVKDFFEENLDLNDCTSINKIDLGVLILEKPLAFILGLIPNETMGKINILKIPQDTSNHFASEKLIPNLIQYLLALPQTTKGNAGGHRIPRGEEGSILKYARYCTNLININNNQKFNFANEEIIPKVLVAENENGEISLKLKAFIKDNENQEIELSTPLYLLGNISYVLSEQTFYNGDFSALQKLFPFIDSFGQLNVRLDLVPKFLATDLPNISKKLPVLYDETLAPFPRAVNDNPNVMIKLSEKANLGSTNINDFKKSLDLNLAFKYQDVILASKDETGSSEIESYTRTIAENGRSVWVKRHWELENQVRRFLLNLQPKDIIVDRFIYVGESAFDVLFHLNGAQCQDWEISGNENLEFYHLRKNEAEIQAKINLKEGQYKFNFEIQCKSENNILTLASIIDSVIRNKKYVKINEGEYVRIPINNLMSLLKLIGPKGDNLRPLYQAPLIVYALESNEVSYETDSRFKEFLVHMQNFTSQKPLELSQNFVGTLREYQNGGCNWLDFLRQYGLAGILADDMGLGKTIQALAMLQVHHETGKRQPSLIVCPTSVIYNWLAEAQKFTPNLSFAMFLGRDRNELLNRIKRRNSGKPDLIFTTYGIIRRDYEILKEISFDFLVLDEAQNIKNPESLGAIAVKSLTANHRLALSGTPVENRLKELWSLFDFLMPEFLGTYKEFNEQYERPIEIGIESASMRLRKMVHPFILRRLKSQVEKELPDKTDIINLCEMDDDQRSLYLEILSECKQKLFNEIATRGIGASKLSVLAALLRLRQVCCDPRLLKNMKDSQNLVSSVKLGALIDMIEEITDEGHKILVFSQFVEMLTLIRKEFEKKGWRYEYLDGQVPPKERLKRVNKFNQDKNIPVFLISLKAGGTGLNLTGADYVIHYDPWWNPAVENQATDRAHRIGQTKHVFNYKLITKGTVEEKILVLQQKKKDLADLIINSDEGIAKELTKDDLEFLFSY